jgi:predicted MFS family arabinose efflux permease
LTKTQGALILTVRSIFSLAAMEFVIKFHKKTGIRIGVTIAMLGGAAAFFLYGMSGGFAGYCCAAAMSGLAYGFGGMVPVSILINRWFLSRQGLALSVSSAGSGVASIALPPLITYLIETFSLRTTLLLQAAFFVLAGGVIALLVRNKPEDKETTPYVSAKEKRQGKERTYGFDAGRLSMVSMYIAIGMIGMTAFGTIPNFAVHYLGEGFDSMTVSFLISLYGGFLIAGKCIYGYAVDRLGAYRSGFVFLDSLFWALH